MVGKGESMNFLVTGGAGYIGSTLIRMLLDKGHMVKCLDRFFFGKGSLEDMCSNPDLQLIRDDIRWFNPKLLEGTDVVIDMAALSNDPAGELDPSKTIDINYLGRVRVAKLSKEYRVKRYILASSCSVYGLQSEELLTEESPTSPLTTYAKANLIAEKEVIPLSDENFCVTVLRQATVYGLSRRMRFDLAINGMVNAIYETGKVGVMRDGTQWRPFLHVKDTSNAFIQVAEAEKETVNGEIFNVGSNEQNYQIKTLVDMLRETFDFEVGWHWYGDPDKRSYRVDFTKIRKKLDYKVEHTPQEAARNIYNALKDGTVKKTLKTITVQWYKYLLEAEKTVKEVELKDTIL